MYAIDEFEVAKEVLKFVDEFFRGFEEIGGYELYKFSHDGHLLEFEIYLDADFDLFVSVSVCVLSLICFGVERLLGYF